MEFLAPLTGGAPASSSPPGVLALEVDPDAFLFPLLNSWPAISRTGETLLVERRGDQVVFLTTTRERRADALHLAFPVTRTEIPAVKAARGAVGVVTGIDYSGTEVLAAIGPVRGTPWFLVSKVDVAEVDAPLHSLALLTIVIVLAVTVLGGAVLLFFWNSWRARDFQQLYETERELRASEERFTLAFEHAPVGISFTLPDGRVGHTNATLAEMLGRSVAELQGLTVAEITHPDDRAETARLMQATLAGEMDGFKVDKRYLRKDGSGIWTTASVTLLRDGQSRPVNFVAMISDISAGKAAEDALRASEARFRGLFETALIGFALHEIVLDEAGLPADYVYVAVNQAFTDLTGLDAAGVVGRRASEVFAGLPEPPYLAIYGETARGGPPHRFETYFEPLHRHYDIQVFSPQAGQFATVFIDITARKEAEDARREAERELAGMNVELERRVLERTLELEAANAELEAFSYSVSHDLRAPLRALDGFSLALIDDYGEQLDDTATDYLARVRAASQRMGQLIDDLLKLSRVSRREMVREQVDLTALAREVLADLREAEPTRVVNGHVEDGLVAGGDPALLRVVLQNLLANAWKFTSRKQEARIEVGAERRDGVTAYFVRDDGAGFDSTYVDKLFTPFQRLHTAGEFPGTGVGLATVKRIVRRHGGSVWAESVVDSGATFYFTLD
jgi:PAS domain S-box-containing protein